jgi:hypothetical protein
MFNLSMGVWVNCHVSESYVNFEIVFLVLVINIFNAEMGQFAVLCLNVYLSMF